MLRQVFPKHITTNTAMLKKEIRIFFTALMFLTRLPVPRFADHSQEYLEKSARYFPLIGWIVALISAAAYFLFRELAGADAGVFASIIAGILTTGAFHEDGFADVCDAFGGGWTKEKILLIMKDSRLGTYGVTGLVAILGAKFLLLRSLYFQRPEQLVLLLLAAHGFSRFMGVLTITLFDYVTDTDTSKSKPVTARKPTPGMLVTAGVFALLPLAGLHWHIWLALPVVLLVGYRLARYFKKWIGGYTGDCLGAMQQVSELTFYLCVVVIGKYYPPAF